MRLRNIPRAASVLDACKEVIKQAELQKGKWKELYGNENPLHLEIGMGKGQFLLTLAQRNPDINYVGIERYDSVLLRAAEGMEAARKRESALTNVRLICMDAAGIAEVFAPGEVDRIYLNFSDPWPKARHARRRLTSGEYFARYNQILAPDGRVEFKTDNRALFDFSMEQLEASKVWEAEEYTYDLHHDEKMNAGNVMTEYEEKFSGLGNPICKLTAGRQRR